MTRLRRVTIGVIGAGNMGEALMKGLRAAGLSGRRLLVCEARAALRQRVVRRYGVTAATLSELAIRSDVVILAVKPQDIQPVLGMLARSLPVRSRARVLVISIAAGLTLRALERRLGRCAVVRVMPNLAAKVGAAISAIAAGRWATAAHRAIARDIFACVGEVVELPERLFDAVTAISGSGPAYFFLIFQALRDAGVRAGIPRAVAQRLAVQTALGSAQLVKGSTDELEALIMQVASKKGTTEAALKVLRRRDLAGTLHAGVLAAVKRSKELSWLLSKS